jgi:hypothetical protein
MQGENFRAMVKLSEPELDLKKIFKDYQPKVPQSDQSI